MKFQTKQNENLQENKSSLQSRPVFGGKHEQTPSDKHKPLSLLPNVALKLEQSFGHWNEQRAPWYGATHSHMPLLHVPPLRQDDDVQGSIHCCRFNRNELNLMNINEYNSKII